MKKYNDFLRFNQTENMKHIGDYIVSKDEVKNGRFIKPIPNIIEGNFICDHLDLTTLEGGPIIIKGKFDCTTNKLTNLDGGPLQIYRDYNCSRNYLTSLKGIPSIIDKDLICNQNNLTDLKDGPKEIKGNFYCQHNLLTSLEGNLKIIKGVTFCDSNTNKVYTEAKFIEYGHFKDNYWKDLASYILKNNKDFSDVKGWPKDFLTDELKTSAKIVSKFNL